MPLFFLESAIGQFSSQSPINVWSAVPILQGVCVCRWKTSLALVNPKAAASLADPAQYPNLFPGLDEALQTEQFLERERCQQRPAGRAAAAGAVANWERRPVDEMRLARDAGTFVYVAPGSADAAADVDEEEEEEKEEEEQQQQQQQQQQEQEEEVHGQVGGTDEPAAPVRTAPAAVPVDPVPVDPVPVTEPAAVEAAAPAPVAATTAAAAELDDADLDLDLENLDLDDNVDTTDVNLDDDFLDF